MSNQSFVPIISMLLTFVLGICFQVLVSSPDPEYRGFHRLDWGQLEGCSPDGIPVALAAHVRGVGTYDIRYPSPKRSCRSTTFTAPAPRLEFEVAAGTQDAGRLEVYAAQGQVLVSEKIQATQPGQWVRLPVQIPEAVLGTPISVVIQQSADPGWIAIRDRLTFYQPTAIGTLFERFASFPYIAALILVALAAAACRYFYWLMESENSDLSFFFHLLMIIFFVHFRVESYIFWDEWNILDRFREEGFAGIFHIHNEHFIPLFLLFYFLESILFGTFYQGYLLVSIVLHAVNACLLYSILREISGSKAAARLLAVLFALSGMHSEVLHWAFEQSILFSQVFVFLAIGGAIKYFRQGAASQLWLIGIYSALAPLFFGNGFIVFIQIAVLLSYLFITSQTTASTEVRLKRSIYATLCSASVLIVPAVLYVVARNRVAVPFLSGDQTDSIRGLTDYLFVGTQLGSILRGIGLFPSLLLDRAAPDALRAISWFVPDPLLFWSSPEFICATAGAFVGFGLLLLSLLGRKRLDAVLLWCAGQLILITAFILPGLVRWQIGSFQALALRYQYSAFIGLCCIVLPALLYLLSCRRYDAEKGDSRIAKSFRAALAVGLFFHIGINLYRSQHLTFFTSNSEQNKSYILQLSHWRRELKRHNNETYEGLDSPIYGLQPIYPQTITPKEYPVDIYAVLNWLNPWKYP